MSPTSSSPNVTLAIVASAIFIGVVFFVLLVKKFYCFFFKHKRFFVFPRFGIYGITNVAMVIAITVSVVLLLVIITGGVAGFLFRAYPGSRVTFEIVLVKISGLLFGPVIGLLSGAMVDLFSFSFSAGVFHYGYFISVSMMGLLAGILRSITNSSNDKLASFSFFGTIYLVVITAVVCIIFYFFSGLEKSGINVKLTGIISFNLPFSSFVLGIIGFSSFAIFVIWFLVFISFVIGKSRHKKRFSHVMHARYIKWLIVSILASVSTTLVIYITLLPVFDSSLDKQPYEWWLGLRMIIAIPLVIIDVVVVFPMLALITSFVKYDDKESVYADIGEPLFYNDWSLNTRFIDSNRQSIDAINSYSRFTRFDLDNKQIKSLEYEFLTILKGFQLVVDLNTDNVAPMDFSIEKYFYNENRLRDDLLTESESINSKKILEGIRNKKIYNSSQFVWLHFLKNNGSSSN